MGYSRAKLADREERKESCREEAGEWAVVIESETVMEICLFVPIEETAEK